MTKFGLEPGFVKVRYTDAHRTHFQTIQVDPSGVITVGTEPHFAVKGGGDALMSDCLTGYVDVMKTQLAAASTIVSAEFWSKPLEADDPVWIFAVDLGVAGTGGGTESFTRQINRSFRSGAGHIMRNVIEGISTAIPNDFHGAIPNDDVIAVYILSNDSWLQARDNSFCFASLNYNTKTNDALRKKELGL